MKHLKNLVLFVLLASAQFAYSAEECDACDPCNVENQCDLCNISFCDMEFEAYVDALYWHGCTNNLFYDTSDGKSLSPDYSWGWRLGASAYWNTWDVGIRYTSFSSKTNESYYENQGEITDIVSSYDIDYKVFDLEIGRACCVCEGILFRPFFGGKFASIEITRHCIFNYYENIKQELDGCGLYVGFDNRWSICSFNVCDRSIPVAFVSRFSTGMMDSNFKNMDGSLQPLADSEYDVIKKHCQFVPVHEVYAGLEFRMCGLCNADAFFQIGYEAQYWGWKEAGEFLGNSHLGLGGMVLRFGANF